MKLSKFITCLSCFLTLLLGNPFAYASSISDWHQYYRPINDAHSQHMLVKSLDHAQLTIGSPVIPISKVNLRLSKPLKSHYHLKTGFQLTEISNDEKGEFTIYVSRTPQEYAFAGQLAHEVAHLLNPNITDAYYEGLCTVFAEEHLKTNNLDFSGWLKFFEKNRDPFYSQTYFLMREIFDEVGQEAMMNFHLYTLNNTHNTQQLAIDIEKWLQTLGRSQQAAVKNIINQHADLIQESINQANNTVSFLIPH